MIEARNQFIKLLDQYGNEIIRDESRFKSLLGDFFQGKHKAERNILVSSINAGIPDRLLNESGTLPYSILRSQCAGLLEQEGFEAGLSHWAVDTWAMGLKIINPIESEKNKGSLKKPQKTPPQQKKSTPPSAVSPPSDTDPIQQTTPSNSNNPPSQSSAIVILLLFCLMLIGGVFFIGPVLLNKTSPQSSSASHEVSIITKTPTPVTTRASRYSSSSSFPPTSSAYPGGKLINLLNSNSNNFDLAQTSGPLAVEMKIYPEMVRDEKTAYSGSGDMSGTTYRSTRPERTADVRIMVTKKETGELLSDEYYSNFVNAEEQRDFRIYKDGPYNFAITGKKVVVDLYIH